MKIKTKLIIGFAVAITCVWLAIFHANAMAYYTEGKCAELENLIIPGVLTMSSVDAEMKTANLNIAKYAIYYYPENKRDAITSMENLEKLGQENLTITGNTDPESLGAAQELTDKIASFNTAGWGMINLVDRGGSDEELLAFSRETLAPVSIDLAAQAQEQKEDHMALLAANEAEFHEVQAFIFHTNLAAGGMITAIGVVVAAFVTRQIVSPLNDLHKGTAIIGKGRLDYKVGTKKKDEIGRLSRAFDDMTNQLSSSLVSIDNLREEISKRERTELALRASEEKLRRIFEAAGDGIAVTDLDGNIIEANESLAKMLGFGNPESITGKNMSRFIPPYEIKRSKPHLQKVLKQKSVVVAELNICGSDGIEFPIEINASVLENTSGERIGQVAILRDISLRKRMEENLNKRLRELDCHYSITDIIQKPKATLERIFSDIVEILPKSWQYPEITAARIIYENKEFATDNFQDTIWEQSADLTVHGERVGQIEVHYLESRPELDEGEGPFLKEERQLLDAVAERLAKVIERKRTELALKESEEKYRALVENATDYIYMIDSQDQVISLNKAGAEFLGKSQNEVIGKNVSKIFPQKIAAQFIKDLKLAFKVGKRIFADTRMDLPGKETWVSTSLSPIMNSNNEVIAVMGVSRDITERRQMLKELQEKNERLDAQNEELHMQSEELMAQQHELAHKTEEVIRANRLKSEFMANMSHELRTPLNVIIGFSQLMVDEVMGKINDKQRQCLDDVLDSSQNLLTLINDILDLSKIESGKMELRPESVSLPEIITYISRSMMPILALKKQRLDIDVEDNLPPVYANKDKLEQVLLNLIDNSSKFTPSGGKIKITAKSNKQWCQVSVTDNGVGIDKDDQQRVFEPFCQLNNAPHKEPGTGLGLALVKQIIERYNGKLELESELGKGSKFIFSIPLAKNHRPEEEE